MSDGVNGTKHVFDDPQNVKRLLRWFFMACAIVIALDPIGVVVLWLGGPELRHPERPWEGFPGFYGIYGFVACVVLVLIAKQMRRVLMRDEDYYDR